MSNEHDCFGKPAQRTESMHARRIEACLNRTDRLTKWESDFVSSIADQLEQRGHISERQAEILERIYVEKGA